MTHNAECWRLPRAVHAIVAISLIGCATVSSEDARLGTCPPVVEYGRAIQALAAEELVGLPGESMIMEMLSDYSVMRDQARVPLKAGPGSGIEGSVRRLDRRAKLKDSRCKKAAGR